MTQPQYKIPDNFTTDVEGVSTFSQRSLDQYWEYRDRIEKIHKIINSNDGCRHRKIGILDTGFDWRHPDLKNVNIGGAKGFTGEGLNGLDQQGHGSIVGDQISRVCPNATFYIAQVLNRRGSGSSDWIRRGAEWLADQGCEYINASLGSNQPDPRMGEFLDQFKAVGLLIAAAGNAGPVPIGWPANWGMERGTAPIGAYDSSYNRASFQQVGPNLLLCGAGVDILAARAGTAGRTRASGTSMGTPHVAGQIVNIDVAKRRAGWSDTPYNLYEQEIPKFTVDMEASGRDDNTGFGYIDYGKIHDYIDSQDDTGII